MITIKEAKNKAEKLIKVPSLSTLGDWVSKEYISGPIDFICKGRAGGRKGLYPDNLPVQIAVTQELKTDYKLSEIGEARKKLSGLNLKYFNGSEKLTRQWGNIKDPEKRVKELGDEIKKIPSKEENFKEWATKREYFETYRKFAEKLLKEEQKAN